MTSIGKDNTQTSRNGWKKNRTDSSQEDDAIKIDIAKLLTYDPNVRTFFVRIFRK